MTHKYQGKNLPTPHTPACTAAPGPCICTNVTADADVLRPEQLNSGRLESVTLDPNGLGMIGLRVDDLPDTTTITDKDGEVVAIFDADGTLTGGTLRRAHDVYKTIIVAARNENQALSRNISTLRKIHEKSERSSRNTIITLVAALIINFGVSLGRAFGWWS